MYLLNCVTRSLSVSGLWTMLIKSLYFGSLQPADAAGRGVVEVAQQLVLVAVQQSQRVGRVDAAVGGQLTVHLRQLPGLQLVLEVHLAAGVQQAPDGLPAAPANQGCAHTVPAERSAVWRGPCGPRGFCPAAAPARDFFALLKQLVDGAQGLGGFLVVAKAQDRERHGLAVVGDGLQLFHNAVDGMVVVAGKKAPCAR